jgi:hypothetical protein
MTYFVHKKSKKLVELLKTESGVCYVKEYGKKQKKQMKVGLFQKLFDKLSDEEAEEIISKSINEENEKIQKKQQEMAAEAKPERKPRKKRKAAEPIVKFIDSDRYKELYENHICYNSYELIETGHEVHTMVIGLEGKNAATSLTYTSYIKINHNGFARTYTTFNGKKLVDYNNIGIAVTAADFCEDLGLSEEDLRMLMMSVRSETVKANKDRYTVEDIKQARANWAGAKKAKALKAQSMRMEKIEERKKAFAESKARKAEEKEKHEVEKQKAAEELAETRERLKAPVPPKENDETEKA